MTVYGVDLSHWNSDYSIEKEKPGFVIVKTSDGTRFVDKKAEDFIRQCKRAGIPFGFYHFANSVKKSSMIDQAHYFVEKNRSYFGDGLPVLDWEDSAYGGEVLSGGPYQAKLFLDEVERMTGYRPLIYMSASVCTEYNWKQVAEKYLLWGAAYHKGANYSRPYTTEYRWGAFKSPVIHQYSSSGGLDKSIGYFWSWKDLINHGKEERVMSSTTAYDRGTAAWQALGKDNQERWLALHVLDMKMGRKAGVHELAEDALEGRLGNGEERKRQLGPYYDSVQKKVNEALRKK